jgi:hypothetical protein
MRRRWTSRDVSELASRPFPNTSRLSFVSIPNSGLTVGGIDCGPSPNPHPKMIAAEKESGTPSDAVGNGRTKGGKFAPGNKAGKGNPNLKKVHAIKTVFLDVASEPGEMDAVVRRLFTMAKAGDIDAIRYVCDRVYGKAAQPIEMTGGTDSRMTVEVTYRLPDKPVFNRADASN